MNALKSIGSRFLLILMPMFPAMAWAQQADTLAQLENALDGNEFPRGEGWAGFLDVAFLGHTLLTLVLATVLGAIIAYHPKHIAAADTLEEIEAPKVYILYAVIGAIIGILVVEYGLVVGFVLFGIGGLIRFRTLLRSANLTGRVIFVTLIGLTVGLNLPHVAVLATAFAFVLVYVIEARVTYRVDIRALEPDHIAASAAAYRTLLEQHGCRVLSERKNPEKHRVTLLVAGPPGVSREQLEERVASGIEASLRGAVDWRTD
jgi:hypothetical protein